MAHEARGILPPSDLQCCAICPRDRIGHHCSHRETKVPLNPVKMSRIKHLIDTTTKNAENSGFAACYHYSSTRAEFDSFRCSSAFTTAKLAFACLFIG